MDDVDLSAAGGESREMEVEHTYQLHIRYISVIYQLQM